jgi:hypothetical protein
MARRNHPVTNLQPTQTGQKPSEDNAVTNVTNFSPTIETELEVLDNLNMGGLYRDELVTLVTSVTPPGAQKWEPGARVQVGHPQSAKRFVALNEEGTQRIGEDHPRAKLSDAQVEQIRDEYEAHPQGHPEHVGYRLLAKKWNIHPSMVRNIVTYRRRNQWAGRWKQID